VARIKTPNRKKLENWDQVNEALRRINELVSAIGKKTHEYNEEDAKRRAALDAFCNPLRSEVESLELGMEDYCNANREDFGDKKSKDMPNGVVSFRVGNPKVDKDKGLTWAKILELVKNSRFVARFVRTVEEINKEQILADWAGCRDEQEKEKLRSDLATLYMKVSQDETFGYSLAQAMDATL
jgi:phage host-nuclease inhibitor protein Gam